MIHKQNFKRLWRVQARMRQEARRLLNDPEWCRRAEERRERGYTLRLIEPDETMAAPARPFNELIYAWPQTTGGPGFLTARDCSGTGGRIWARLTIIT